MELTELRSRIDQVDRTLVDLLEQRMDVSADIAAYKRDRGIPVLDEKREAEKIAAIRAMCRPETAELIADVFVSILAASRSRQHTLLEDGRNE